VSYDPNIRPALLGQQSVARIEQAVAVAHLVKVSDEDLATLQPDSDPSDTARRWLERGPALVVVTAGAEGARAFRPGRDVVAVPSADVVVADTIGAGDTFTAGLLTALLDMLDGDIPPAEGLAALSDAQVATALRTAAAASGVTVTRPGCDPPTAADVQAALDR
jgi:fructokinase